MNVGAKSKAGRLLAIAVMMTVGLSGCSSDDKDSSSSSSTTTADVSKETEAVLAVEAQWLTAITAGDKPAIESILAPEFRHTNSDGKLLDRAAEMETIVPVSFTMNPTEQIVTIVSDTAVIHGVNTIVDGGKVLARERFTDVFVKQDGKWLALAAQETNYP
jgi:hypothetical protein